MWLVDDLEKHEKTGHSQTKRVERTKREWCRKLRDDALLLVRFTVLVV